MVWWRSQMTCHTQNGMRRRVYLFPFRIWFGYDLRRKVKSVMKTRLAGLLLCIMISPAWGHIDVEPRQSIARRWETYTLRVPTETKTATVKIRAVVPRAFDTDDIPPGS